MARTSSLNCLSCRDPYQTPHSLNPSPLFTENPFFFTEKCFVGSPAQKSALILGVTIPGHFFFVLGPKCHVYFIWIQEGFTAEPPRNDSGANSQSNDSDSGPKVRVTGRKSELRTKSRRYSRADPQNPNRIAQKWAPNGV